MNININLKILYLTVVGKQNNVWVEVVLENNKRNFKMKETEYIVFFILL